MGEEKRKDEKAGDKVESPRKSPRLSLLDAAVADPAGSSAAVPQELSSDSADGGFCKHLSMEVGQLNLIVEDVTSSKEPPICEDCGFDICKTKAGAGGGGENAGIMVCTVCNSRFCSGVAAKHNPMGHARLHANSFRHWVALWYSEPFNGYCFSCARALNFDGSDGEDEDEDEDEWGLSDGVYDVDDDAGGHAPGLANGDGYVIRGMPNLGFTCYMNAVVQCLFALGKLRTMMLGPDAPSGLLGTTLHDLFAETSSANYVRRMRELKPQSLLQAIKNLDGGFVGMQDSYTLLLCLLNGLESELPQTQGGGDPSAVVRATTASIFRVQLTYTRFCKACSNTLVSHEVLKNLSASMPSRGLPTTDKSKAEKVQLQTIAESGGSQILGLHNLSASLPPEGPPVTSVVSPPMAKGCRSPTKPRRSICTELFPAIDESGTQKIQTVAGESLIPGSELGEVVMGNAPKTLQDGSTEVNICQSKEVVHEPLQTRKNDATGEMIEVPINVVDFLPPFLDEKFGGVDESETTAESHDPGRINSLASIEGGLISNHFKEEKLEDWRCENCAATQVITTEMSCSEKDSTSCTTANKSPECHEVAQEVVPSCLPAEKNTDLPSAQDSQNASTQNQGKGKQVKLDHSAHQKEDNQSKQKDVSARGIQTTVISELPPVLIILVKRYAEDGSKLSGHISFKEILDVGSFMNASCEDKDNSSYRLVGVVEHIGSFSIEGHYVAYVRAGHKQQGIGSSSWFRADDSIVREVSLERVLRCEAFLLFYERMGG